MGTPLRVLIIEDSANDARRLARALQRGGWDPVSERVETAEELGAALDRGSWDIVLTEYSLPRLEVPEALEVIGARGLDLPVIIVSGSLGATTAVQAIKAGAHDYVTKDRLARLGSAVQRELRAARDRAERRAVDAQARRLAYEDPLTGLPNRARLFDRLEDAIRAAGPRASRVALLHVDISRFREINGTMGHRIGDELLRQVARRLRDAAAPSAGVARLGGDEFAVVLTGAAGPSDVAAAASRIIAAMESPFLLDRLPLDVGVTIGIALWPDHAPDADALVQRAGIALDAAKRTRAGWLVYAPEQDRMNPRQLALAGDLRTAIHGDQLRIAYQPELELAVGRTLTVEALVRWQHPRHGLLAPDEFIGLGERTGMIRPLTFRVLDAALAQAARWRDTGMDLTVAVNLSVRNLQDSQFPGRVADLLRNRGIPGRCLEFEITETVIMEDPGRAMAIFSALSELGVSLAIDDFGTGYSSLSYLKRLPVSVLKIDRSFVTNLVADRGDAVIVRSTIELAHMLGLTVVAEGVESDIVLNQLAAFGCNAAQGFHVCRPLPPDGLAGWLHDSPWGWRTEPGDHV